METAIVSLNITNKRQRYGWDEEDQMEGWELFFGPNNHNSTLSEVASSDAETEHNSNSSEEGKQDHATSDDDSEDYIWDTSPDQYALHDPTLQYATPRSLQPLMSLQVEPPNPHLQPAFHNAPRQRTYGTSQNPLRRQNAFRTPKPDYAFLETPPPLNQTPDTRAPRKSRIPTPVSPSDVDLNAVTDISLLPTHGQSLRRSQRQTTRIFYGARPRMIADDTRDNTLDNGRRGHGSQQQRTGRDREGHKERRNTAQAHSAAVQDSSQPVLAEVDRGT